MIRLQTNHCVNYSRSFSYGSTVPQLNSKPDSCSVFLPDTDIDDSLSLIIKESSEPFQSMLLCIQILIVNNESFPIMTSQVVPRPAIFFSYQIVKNQSITIIFKRRKKNRIA